MLVSMKSILEDANKNYYGVMAMNSINIEMARAGIEAAAEQRSPIIIQFGPGQMKNHAHKEEMIPLIKELAARVTIPVALNLDHGMDFKSLLNVSIKALQMSCLTGQVCLMKKTCKRRQWSAVLHIALAVLLKQN